MKFLLVGWKCSLARQFSAPHGSPQFARNEIFTKFNFILISVKLIGWSNLSAELIYGVPSVDGLSYVISLWRCSL
jgi:hypothetical protein